MSHCIFNVSVIISLCGCVRVCALCVHVCVDLEDSGHACIFICSHSCVGMHICIYMYSGAYTVVYFGVWKCVCLGMCVYVCVCLCVEA